MIGLAEREQGGERTAGDVFCKASFRRDVSTRPVGDQSAARFDKTDQSIRKSLIHNKLIWKKQKADPIQSVFEQNLFRRADGKGHVPFRGTHGKAESGLRTLIVTDDSPDSIVDRLDCEIGNPIVQKRSVFDRSERSQIGMLRQQKSLLKNDRQRLEQLRGELRWEGKARDTYIRKQDDMIDDLNQIERRLDDLIDTIENTAKAIRKTDEELARQWRR